MIKQSYCCTYIIIAIRDACPGPAQPQSSRAVPHSTQHCRDSLKQLAPGLRWGEQYSGSRTVGVTQKPALLRGHNGDFQGASISFYFPRPLLASPCLLPATLPSLPRVRRRKLPSATTTLCDLQSAGFCSWNPNPHTQMAAPSLLFFVSSLSDVRRTLLVK